MSFGTKSSTASSISLLLQCLKSQEQASDTLPDSLLTPLEIIKILFVNAAGRVTELCYLIEVVAHHTHLSDQLLQLWQLQPEDYFLQSKIPQECAGIYIPCFLCPLLNLIALLGGHIELDGIDFASIVDEEFSNLVWRASERVDKRMDAYARSKQFWKKYRGYAIVGVCWLFAVALCWLYGSSMVAYVGTRISAISESKDVASNAFG